MVHDKRKPILLVIPPKNVRDDQEIWHIEQTGEWFVSYEAYLHRLDYYHQRRFRDTVSGTTGLTFFEAYRAERDGQQAIEADFPSVLRDPILRKAQFSTIGRLDDLVDSLFTAYKDNIMPGEEVYVLEARNGARTEGIVTEKAVFSASKTQPEMARIFVKLISGPGEQTSVALVDQHNIRRKPKAFTKYALTRFLRTSLERASYDGAPWTVKAKYANEYGMNTAIPEYLTKEALAHRKAFAPKKVRSYNGIPAHWCMKNGLIIPRPGHHPSMDEIQYLQERYPIAPISPEQALLYTQDYRRPSNFKSGEIHMVQPAPPPPIKYPIEDLQLEPKGADAQRPPMKDFTQYNPFPEAVGKAPELLSMLSIGSLLKIWDTMQVFSGYFKIDGFTLDDFYGAMLVTSEQIPCLLFDEIHCTVLEKLFEVSSVESGELSELGSKTLLDALDVKRRKEEEASSSSGSGSASPAPDDQNEITLRPRTNGDVPMTEAPSEQTILHRGAEMAPDHTWPGKVLRSEFPDGGWQMVMIGVLEQLSHLDRYKSTCDRLLLHLAPLDLPATYVTAKWKYSDLNIDDRIEILQMVMTLTFETKAFKNEMLQIMTDATETRKAKIGRQSEKKGLVSELEKLDKELRRRRQNEASASPGAQQGDESVNGDGSNAGDADEDQASIVSKEESHASSDDESAVFPEADRRASGRAAALKRKREADDEREKTQLDEEEAKENEKMRREIEKAHRQVEECETAIVRLEGDLRENACHRTKVLGVDRYFNRYIWFERNGMPFTGPDESSTQYGYANGRLWVQGGDKLDRQGIVNLDEADEEAHQTHFHMTMAQRRDLEEGPTQLKDADTWAYYDTAESFDGLLSWLCDKGERERKLKRELTTYREPIIQSMANMHAHLAEMSKKFEEFEERPQRGVALRRKDTSEADKANYPCLLWTNEYILDHWGFTRSDGHPFTPLRKASTRQGKKGKKSREMESPPPPEKGKKGKKGPRKVESESPPPEKEQRTIKLRGRPASGAKSAR